MAESPLGPTAPLVAFSLYVLAVPATDALQLDTLVFAGYRSRGRLVQIALAATGTLM